MNARQKARLGLLEEPQTPEIKQAPAIKYPSVPQGRNRGTVYKSTNV